MKEYMTFEATLFMKDRKNTFLFLAVPIFLIGLLFYILFQRVNDISDNTQSELNLVRAAISQFPVHIVEEDPEAYPVYQSVLEESQLIARQEVALTMSDDLEEYAESGLALADARIEAHEIGYETVEEAAFIPVDQSQRQKVFYQALIDKNLLIERDAQSGPTFIVIGLTLLSRLFFIYLLLLACDVLTKDDAHQTVLEAYPISGTSKLLGKLVIYFIATVGMLVFLFGMAHLFSLIPFQSGTLAYPRVIYTASGYEAISTTHFLIIAFLLLALFTIHTVLFAALLNRWLKNQYLTLFLGSSFLLIAFLFASWKELSYTPIPFLNPISVLTGDAAVGYAQPALTFIQAMVIYIVWSLIYCVLLAISFSKSIQKLPLSVKGGE